MLDYKGIITKAWSYREKYINLSDTNVFRLINSYGDGVPEVTVDIYGKNILVQFFSPFETHAKENIYMILKEIFAPENITEKIRLKGKEVTTYPISKESVPEKFVVKENGISFGVSFAEGGATGLYLDQRDNRKKIHMIARDKEVLNCFCYTSSFSIYATFGGAVKTTNIDLSRRAIEWSRQNFSLNQIDLDKHEFIVGNVWDWLKRFQRKKRTFDIIILDPPSFSTSKAGTFSVEKDTPRLMAMGLNILRDNGILVFSTNIAKMHFSKFFEVISRVKEYTLKPYRIIHVSSQGLDFPVDTVHIREPYLKFIMLTA